MGATSPSLPTCAELAAGHVAVPPARTNTLEPALQLAFEASHDAMLLVRCDDNLVLTANLAASRIYGYMPYEMAGRALQSLTAESSQSLDLVAQRREHAPLRFHRRADGTHFPVEINLRYFEDGVQTLCMMAVRDVSPQLLQERLRQETETRYRAVFDAAPYPIMLVSPTGHITDANPQSASLYGFEVGKLIDQRLDQRVQQPSYYVALFSSRPNTLPPHVHLRADGSQFLAEVTISYLRVLSKPMATLLIRDVTDEQRTLERIAASEARWRFALEGHGDGLWDWDMRDNSVTVSPQLKAILGYRPGEATASSHSPEEHIHPDDLPLIRKLLAEHISGQTPMVTTEIRVRHRDGGYRWVSCRAKVMEYENDGRPRRVIGTWRDIDQSRRQEELERIQREEIAHAGRLINLGAMASALGHELNQPLTSIRLFSSVALRRLAELPAAEALLKEPLTAVAEQSLRAGEIVRGIRDFVRKRPPRMDPVDINHIVGEAVRFVRNRLEAANVQFDQQLAPDLPPLLADPIQIQQVLINLFHNGIEAMNRVEGERRLSVRTSTNEAGRLLVEVTDRGEGLPEAIRQDLFSPFVSTKPEGMGLGLAICRMIIDSHHGRLWARSGPEGTVFSFELPFGSDPE